MRVQGFGWIARIAPSLAIVVAAGCGGDGGPASVTSLRFATSPGSVDAGEEFTVTVELLKSDGDVLTSATNEIVLTIVNPGAAVLNGTTTVAAVAGVATFTGLSINQAGGGRQFQAALGAMSSLSTTFSVARGPVSPTTSSLIPAPGNIPPESDTPIFFTFLDEFNNPVANAAVAFTTSLPGSFLTPANGVSAADGKFSTLLRSPTSGSATLGVVVEGVPIVVNAPFVVADLCPTIPAMAFPGTANGVQPCGAYVSTAVAPSLFSFTSPGGGASFTLTGNFPPFFQVKSAEASNDVLISADAMPATFEWLLPAGSYFFSVRKQSAPGSFTATSTSTSGTTVGVARALVVPGTYSGQQLQAGDRTFSDASFYDLYVYVSADPCEIRLQTGAFAPYLAVDDAITGAILAPDVTTAPGVDAVISLAACHGGTNNPIIIYANSFAGGESGTYTLVVSQPNPTPSAARASQPARTVTLQPTLRVSAAELHTRLRTAKTARGGR